MISRIVLSAGLVLALLPFSSPASPHQASSANNAQEAATDKSRFDGPAELPRLHVASAMADSPAPGRTLLVKQGDDLQAAIDKAKCGDVLSLQAGATFSGLFRFPAKPCDDSHWVIVRTSAPDASLPPEGTRMTPCYAGIASLPGRPDFHCSSPRNVLAKIVLDQKTWSGPILFLDKANHYRFVGLEITRALPDFRMRNLIQPEDANASAHHLIFDRLWLHGTAQDETKAGIHLSGTSYVAVVDSYLNDFKCIALQGSCTDAQAINGGTADLPAGPWKIENNFLEGSGQSIIFGGARGTTTPADIEIRRNHLFKPLIWMPGQTGFVGAINPDPSKCTHFNTPGFCPFIVKNNFELKNAERVLFEGNILENSWGGFTQAGFSILLMPSNQNNGCPTCKVRDITIRYNKIIRVASALTLTSASPNGFLPSAGERYSIHDLLVQDIQGEAFQGFGLFALIGSKKEPPLRDVRIDHVTAFPTRAIFTIQDRGDKVSGFSLTNSILGAGEIGGILAGLGPRGCAAGIRRGDTIGILNSCFDNPIVSHNLILGAFGEWPQHNILVKDSNAAGLWKKSSETGPNYRVCPGKDVACGKASPGYRSAMDGKDIGADIDTIEKLTSDVI